MLTTTEVIELLVDDIVENDPLSEAQAPTLRAAMLLMLRDDEIERLEALDKDTAPGEFR